MSADVPKELKNIATVVRALVTSRKSPCLLRDILREYPEVENKPLQYRALGFKTPQELLEATGEFNFGRYGADTCIAVKLNVKSEHIAKFVKQQRSSKSKNQIVTVKQTRNPKRTDHQLWNKSSYSSNVYGKQTPNFNPRHLTSNRGSSSGVGGGDRNNNQIDENYKRVSDIQEEQKKIQQKIAQTTKLTKQTSASTATAAAKPLVAQKQQQQQKQKQQQQQKPTKDIKNETENKQNKQTENNFRDLRDMLNSKSTLRAQQQQQQQQQQHKQNNNNINGQNDLADMVNSKMKIQQGTAANQNVHAARKSTLHDRLNLNGKGGGDQPQQQHQHDNLQSQKAGEDLLLEIQHEKQLLLLQHMQEQEQHQQQQQQQRQRHLQQQYKQQQQQQQHQLKFGSRAILGNGAAANTMPFVNADNVGPVKRSVQQRLRINIDNSVPPSTNGIELSSTATKIPSSSPMISSAGSDIKQNTFMSSRKVVAIENSNFTEKRPYHKNKQDDPVAQLAQYCLDKNFDAPAYTYANSKFRRNMLCRVSINGTVYSTYPNEFTDEISARIACAKIALEKIHEQDAKQILPPCQYTDQEFIDLLHNELLKHPTGIFAKNMDKWYENTFKEKLKENWWTLVHTSIQFKTEVNCDNIIVFANTNVVDELNRCPSADTLLHIEPIDLPWSSECWPLYITFCESTTEVWARLFGADYSERFEELMHEVESYMQQSKARPRAIAPQQIYLVNVSNCWHRVRVEKLDKENGMAHCFFIDFGDANWFPVDNLYICELKFLQLPAQAVPFLLYGLEDFASNPYARSTLDTQLSTKSVVAKIFTKELEFYSTESNTCGKVQAVMYDTSTEEDVNINHKLLQHFCDCSQPPELKRKGVTNAIISHIGDTGDVYLCLKSEDSKYVEALLHNIIASKIKCEQHQATPADLKPTNVFLICDDHNVNAEKPQWYRGVLVKNQKIHANAQEYDMFYIDNGQTRRTQLSKIYRLDSLSTALAKFPAQAIQVRLHNIPEITPTIVGRMRALLPNNCEALIKVAENNDGAAGTFITAYIRQESGTLCTVNDTIRIEYELEQCSADNSDDTNSIASTTTKSIGGNSSKPIKDMAMGLTVPNSPTKDAVLPKLKEYSTLPVYDDVFLEVRVTMSANPWNFTIQPYRDYPTLRTLMKELQEYCDNNDEFIPADMVEIGQAYAAKHTNGLYHRVKVVNVYAEMIHVFFSDFGDVSVLRSDQLKILPEIFRQLPQMAIQAKLHGIKPREDSWSHDDCIRFRELTVGQKFVSIIKTQTIDETGSRILELELIDVSSDVDIYIHNILLTEQRALKA